MEQIEPISMFHLKKRFGEVKLADLNANYDFISVRAGIQPLFLIFVGLSFSDKQSRRKVRSESVRQ